MKNFNKEQIKVIKSKDNLLVIAGPGSGKTTTIIEKVNYLLKDTNPNDILIISFTNQSVNDIKNKLDNKNIFVTTFHSLAIDILKNYNYEYSLCQSNLLNYIIDEYFSTSNNNKLKYKYNIKKFNNKDYNYINLKKLIQTFINLFKTNGENINNLYNMLNNYKDKDLTNIIFNIINIYENEKRSTNALDFDDLIIIATKLLHNNYIYRKFKYIIIDEYQDTSYIRFKLIKEIYDNSSSIITAVGDDAQSIYHFSGCDVKLFLDFKKYFPNAKIINLKHTYRNSQELINITTKFINKNPFQIKKNMISNNHINNPIIYKYYIKSKKILTKTLKKLNNKTILILGRNNNDIYRYLNNELKFENGYIIHKNNKYKYLTMHSSKGLEEDYVIILNNSNNKYGIPNKLKYHEIIKYVTTPLDNYKYAEERRLFFVALTRCRYKVILLIPLFNSSPFIKEIKKIKLH